MVIAEKIAPTKFRRKRIKGQLREVPRLYSRGGGEGQNNSVSGARSGTGWGMGARKPAGPGVPGERAAVARGWPKPKPQLQGDRR
ncbi:hypothetical protein GCM10011341_09860 [Frigidibacter albus]|nr:hypothetical protein GCM10011341_09860 [Frigidibacter albus]